MSIQNVAVKYPETAYTMRYLSVVNHVHGCFVFLTDY
jgi:hypothetical protein